MSEELAGARQNAEFVDKTANRMTKEWFLAKAILLIIQHLEKQP